MLRKLSRRLVGCALLTALPAAPVVWLASDDPPAARSTHAHLASSAPVTSHGAAASTPAPAPSTGPAPATAPAPARPPVPGCVPAPPPSSRTDETPRGTAPAATSAKPASSRIEGRVGTASGSPLPGSVIASSPSASFDAAVDERGAFALPSLPPGHYSLTARDARRFTVATAEVEVGQGVARVELVARPTAWLVGHVSGTTECRLIEVAGEGGWDFVPLDHDGGFTVELPPGTYTIDALSRLRGCLSECVEVKTCGGERPESATVTLAPGEVRGLELESTSAGRGRGRLGRLVIIDHVRCEG